MAASCLMAAFQSAAFGQGFKAGQWEVQEGLAGIAHNQDLTDDASRKAGFGRATIPPGHHLRSVDCDRAAVEKNIRGIRNRVSASALA